MTFTYSIFGLDGWNEDKTLPPGWMLDQVSNKYIPSGWIFSSFTVKSQASRSNHANAVSLSQCHGYTLTDIWVCPPNICYTPQYQIYGRLKTLIWKHVFFFLGHIHRQTHTTPPFYK